MPSALTWLCACISLSACLRASLAVPPQHRGWLRLWEEGAGCGKCNLRLCPRAPGGCPAGRVRDDCGCCEQCANVEGQQCDPDGAQKFYGRCGLGLICQRKTSAMRAQRGKSRAEPEPTCVCRDEGPVCGSDGWTYPNVCQLREAGSRSKTILRLTGQGPCYSAPRILRVPRDVSNFTGNDVAFGCEVSGYPLPTLSWKRKGSDHFLPGDDPHISVQLRGGPERYTMSSWLQIQNLQLSHAGIYSCISHNALGGTSAHARLTVMRRVSTVVLTKTEEEENFDLWLEGSDDDDEGGDDGSGDYLE